MSKQKLRRWQQQQQRIEFYFNSGSSTHKARKRNRREKRREESGSSKSQLGVNLNLKGAKQHDPLFFYLADLFDSQSVSFNLCLTTNLLLVASSLVYYKHNCYSRFQLHPSTCCQSWYSSSSLHPQTGCSRYKIMRKKIYSSSSL